MHNLDASKTSEDTGLHFLVSTGPGKPDPALRKFIRSYVMLGKNRGKTLLRRKRRSDDVSSMSFSGSATSSRHNNELVQVYMPPSNQNHGIYPVKIPQKLGSDLSSIHLADGLEPGKIEIVLQFSRIAKQVLFPLEICMFFEKRAENWIAPLSFDPAYLHAIIFTSQYYFDAVRLRQFSTTNRSALPHLVKALVLLRQRFASDEDQYKLSNSTAAAIMGLAGYSHLTGDLKSAKHHLDGLRRIVSLRGGVASFRSNAKLLIEILRCDISLALHCGSRPIFFNVSTEDESSPPFPDLKLLKRPRPTTTRFQQKIIVPLDNMDIRLAQIWKVMEDFCSVIDFAVSSELRISTETFLDTMAAVVYRLLGMRIDPCSTNEAIRLGLLALSCSVFLYNRNLGISYPHLKCTLRSFLLGPVPLELDHQFLLWLLMVGYMSVVDAADDEWMRPLLLGALGSCNLDSWSMTQEVLKQFLWIDLVHSKPGKHMFDSIMHHV